MKIQVVLERSQDSGFTALVTAVPGCISEGDTRERALTNIHEAIHLYLEPVDDEATVSADAEQRRPDPPLVRSYRASWSTLANGPG